MEGIIPLLMEISKSQNGAEILESVVLLRHNSLGYIKGNKVSKWVVNVENIIYEREVLLKASIISACVSDFRLNMKSLSWQYKSKLSPLY